MRRVLVTGADGFIGRNCLPLLEKKGFELHAVSPVIVSAAVQNVQWHRANLLDSVQTEELIRKVKPSHLLHLAWYVAPGKYVEAPENLLWVQASLELIRQFWKNGGERAVFAGTCFEYDLSYGFLTETITPVHPTTLYGTCKASLYQMLQMFSHQYGISLAWGRIFYLYGPGENSSRIIPYIINRLLKEEKALCSNGMQIRDFLHVFDVASALTKLLDCKVEGAFNIGSGIPVYLAEIFKTIGVKLNREELVQLGAVRTGENEPVMIVANTQRLRQEAGWSPVYDLITGLDQTIEWWKQNNLIDSEV